MHTATRITYPTLGHQLAAKLTQSHRRPRPRSRHTRRPQQRAKPKVDPAIADAVLEKALEQSPTARNALRVSQALSLAKIGETMAKLGLEASERGLARVTRRFEAAAAQSSVEAYRTAEAARLRLPDAKRDAADWRRKVVAAERERMGLEHELQGWLRER